MHRCINRLLSFFLAFGAAFPAHAIDTWDSAVDDDDAYDTTDNVLWHSAPPQLHDLQAFSGVADQDWFIVLPRARRSYEVQFLNVTADTRLFSSPPQRTNGTGSMVLETAVRLDAAGAMQRLRWIQGATNSTQMIKVEGHSTTQSTSSDYTIQLRETTQYCARYNNASTQTSVLIIQLTNPDATTPCDYEVRYNDQSGAEVGSSIGLMAAGNSMDVIATSLVPGVAGTRGSAFIAHTCGLAGISAKMVALEPATGFSFDTQCHARPSN